MGDETTSEAGDRLRKELFDLTGSCVVVTGAASGLGLAIAEATATATSGASVVLADIDGAGLGDGSARLAARGLEVLPRVTDVADRRDVAALFADAVGRFGGGRRGVRERRHLWRQRHLHRQGRHRRAPSRRLGPGAAQAWTALGV
jgi:NAD(P)-dependent dehydrogenase (short-subunit alcohol dehydrogenase family)